MTDKWVKNKTKQHPSQIEAVVFLTWNQVSVNDDTFDLNVFEVPTKIQQPTTNTIFKVSVRKQWEGLSVTKAPVVSLPEIGLLGPEWCPRTPPCS